MPRPNVISKDESNFLYRKVMADETQRLKWRMEARARRAADPQPTRDANARSYQKHKAKRQTYKRGRQEVINAHQRTLRSQNLERYRGYDKKRPKRPPKPKLPPIDPEVALEKRRKRAREAQRERRLAMSVEERERAKQQVRKWGERNKERKKFLHQRWTEQHPERVREHQKATSNGRRLGKANPPWVDREVIKAIYLGCPPGHHVDHIVPLNGITPEGYPVCGLHVPGNLQYLPIEENRRKGNRMRYEEMKKELAERCKEEDEALAAGRSW
jgi:hypothetical protein